MLGARNWPSRVRLGSPAQGGFLGSVLQEQAAEKGAKLPWPKVVWELVGLRERPQVGKQIWD